MDLMQPWDSRSASLDFSLRSYFMKPEELTDVTANSQVIKGEATEGHRNTLGLGYTYSFDNRRTGLNPKAGMFLRLSQDFGLTGDVQVLSARV